MSILEMMGFGCAFLDYDGDGRLDILLVTKDHVELYRNRGDGSFENVTGRAFPGAVRAPYLMGCSVCDYDGDGLPDIYVTGHGRTILYHNQGDGTFKDVTSGSGLEARGPEDWTTSAAWTHVAGSRLPDLYVCRYVQFGESSRQLIPLNALDGSTIMQAGSPSDYPAEHGSFYRNEGGGKFRDVTAASGLSDSGGKGLGCMFCDFDNCGRDSLFVANDQRPQDLYLNLDREKYRNISGSSGVAVNLTGKMDAGMGVDWGDYRNEGRFGLLLGTFANEPKCLFRNTGKDIFINEAASSGIFAPSLTALTFGAKFLDTANSGKLDVVLVNGHVQSLVDKLDSTTTYFESMLMFRNEGGGRFSDTSASCGTDFNRKIVGRGIAIGDYDGDGRLDMLVVDAEGKPLLLHNDGPLNHYIEIRCLEANGATDALGTRVTVATSAGSQVREVRASGSYLSTDAPQLHFGLGSAETATVRVSFPDRGSVEFRNVAINRQYTISNTDRRLRTGSTPVNSRQKLQP